MRANPHRRTAEQIYLFVQHLGRRLRDVDRDLGVSPTRFSALAGLAFEGPGNVGDLAAFERVSRPSMTRLVRDMERDGLVLRLPDPDDGRGVRVRITEKGRALVEAVRARKIALVEVHLRGLEPQALTAIGSSFAALDELAEPREETDA
ncbi:MAG TPA: MarR family transcriptional regulator [Caulobacteraceae bacterium]|jgi:DNA-binding MarR family transcriptional regulator|nr:MarR family transcriptional regulator [Caulobacteraceae bacterium]